MQFLSSLLTPQKQPNESKSQRSQFHSLSKYSLREFSPFDLSFSKSPLNVQLQLLSSPPVMKKDLFSELLCTDQKDSQAMTLLTPVSDTIEVFQMESEQPMEDDQTGSSYDDDFEEGDIRKRKRKSSHQINMLKQEMDGEMNWTKEKICHMAEITGLSQSQVYKWCWDQKKKIARQVKTYCKDRLPLRRKIIHKDHQTKDKFSYAVSFECTRQKKNSFEQVQNDSFEATQRKINKKLVFGQK